MCRRSYVHACMYRLTGCLSQLVSILFIQTGSFTEPDSARGAGQGVPRATCCNWVFHSRPSCRNNNFETLLFRNKCLGHKLRLIFQLASNLFHLFVLFYACHMAGYLSSVSRIYFPQSHGKSPTSLYPTVHLSTRIPTSYFLPSAFY